MNSERLFRDLANAVNAHNARTVTGEELREVNDFNVRMRALDALASQSWFRHRNKRSRKINRFARKLIERRKKKGLE